MTLIKNTENILGHKLKVQGINNSIKTIVSWIYSGRLKKTFFCLNPHSIIEAQKDTLFKLALNDADLLTPDGAGIVLASRVLGGSIIERVTGSDIFWGLNHELNQHPEKKQSCFFLGSTEQNLAAIETKMISQYPNIDFVGSYSPPYKPKFSKEDNKKIIEAVNAAKPDILWVGMTAPKQEKWIHQHKNLLDVKFIGAIGAVFDFFVGDIKRSHPFFQKFGLEWLIRFIQEPRRLFKRNFISSPVFLYQVFLQKYVNRY